MATGSALSLLLNRDRILAALDSMLDQQAIDAAAHDTMHLNEQVPAEIIGILAILASLRDSRTDAAHDAEADGFTGDGERDDATRYDNCFAAVADEWQ